MREHASWDPTAYGRYAGERSRPFADLVAQVRADDPALVVDLGCGHGPPTLTLAKLWPNARVVGVDSSESMLESAGCSTPTGGSSGCCPTCASGTPPPSARPPTWS